MISTGITQLVSANFDLLSVGIAIAGIALLGCIIFFNNSKSVTNRTFFYFAAITVLWCISNYLEYRFTTTTATLWALRLQLFISSFYALIFFQLAYVFPQEKAVFPRWYRFILTPVVAVVAILTLTPFVFSGIAALAPIGEVTNPERGPGIVVFSLVAFGLLIASLFVLIQKIIRNKGVERRQTIAIFIGMFAMAVLILLFNVLLPVFLNQLSFIPLAALFVLPFIMLTSYAIYRDHLFNLKVAATAFLGFLVTAFSFVNIIYSTSTSAVLVNVVAFVVILSGSIKIVRDTLSLEELAESLEATNERQEGLIHFISHEVKGYLTKDQGAFAALSEGDFGPLPDAVTDFAKAALVQTRTGVESVMNILTASNLKKGTTNYQMAPFDLAASAADAVEKAKSAAAAKQLALNYAADPAGAPYTFTGDQKEINEHVLRNLIDNAVNYTPSGSIDVSLKKANEKIIFAVKDTGVGVTEGDKVRLFTEGGHGKDSQKVNVHSTGYGLYIAKQVVLAHKGTIRAESEGAGKGSTFIVELPAA